MQDSFVLIDDIEARGKIKGWNSLVVKKKKTSCRI